MPVKTIRAAQFMYYVPTGRTRILKNGDKQEILSVRHALRGDTVDIPRDEDVERGERTGTFMVERIEAGPVETVEDVDTGPDFSSHDALVDWMEENKPSVREVTVLADNDADKAEALLEAERVVTGGHPRKGVVTQLGRIIDEAEDEEEEETDDEFEEDEEDQ
jgi:hypothetical protein